MGSDRLIAAPGYLYALSWSLAAVLLSLVNPPRQTGPRRVGIWAALTACNVLLSIAVSGGNDALYFPTLLSSLALAYGILKLTCRMPSLTALHYTMCAFLTGELISAACWVLFQYMQGTRTEPLGPLWLYLCFGVALVAVLLPLWLVECRFAGNGAMRISGREVAATVLMSMVVFLFSNISNVFRNTPFSGQTPLHISQLRMMADLSGLFMLAANRAAREELRRKSEADMLNRMMAMQRATFQASEQTAALIHQKYHDLKHQIALLRAEAPDAERNARLDGLEADIQGFEAFCRTGNPAMDTLVTAKALQCQSMGIRLTCMAEGALLDFMSPMDLCALLGNLLDNAIEYVSGIEDPERRWILFNLRRRGGFIVLETGNPCAEAPRFADGLPVSTKGDADYHGYGTRSIRRIAAAYGGTAAFAVRDGCFEASVLFSPEAA